MALWSKVPYFDDYRLFILHTPIILLLYEQAYVGLSLLNLASYYFPIIILINLLSSIIVLFHGLIIIPLIPSVFKLSQIAVNVTHKSRHYTTASFNFLIKTCKRHPPHSSIICLNCLNIQISICFRWLNRNN